MRDGLALLGDGVWANPGTAAQRFFSPQNKFPNLWWTMRRWIDELSSRTRVVLTVLVVAITIVAVAWDMIEMSF
ncbi:MAG: hypothetical protein WBL84_29165 [Xanthobacteraceae bacterium]